VACEPIVTTDSRFGLRCDGADWADVADAAVTVIEVVPMHEVARLVPCSIEIGEARVGELFLTVP
jgi:hypothetical protein